MSMEMIFTTEEAKALNLILGASDQSVWGKRFAKRIASADGYEDVDISPRMVKEYYTSAMRRIQRGAMAGDGVKFKFSNNDVLRVTEKMAEMGWDSELLQEEELA